MRTGTQIRRAGGEDRLVYQHVACIVPENAKVLVHARISGAFTSGFGKTSDVLVLHGEFAGCRRRRRQGHGSSKRKVRGSTSRTPAFEFTERAGSRNLLNEKAMGLRGIGATRKKGASERQDDPARRPAVHGASPGLGRAERVIRFVETLPVTAGPLAGTTLKLRPWQKKFIRAVYKTNKQGDRLVRTAVLSVARKNGKTQIAAALCLAHLSGPESEPERRVLTAWPVRASKLAASSMRWWRSSRARRGLTSASTSSGFGKSLKILSTARPMTCSAPTWRRFMDSRRRLFVTMNWRKCRAGAVYDALGTALGGRTDPLMIVISTQAASDVAPMSEMIDYGLRIHRGEIEDASLFI